jgi:hypothetical protein
MCLIVRTQGHCRKELNTQSFFVTHPLFGRHTIAQILAQRINESTESA